jgi:DNA invertase Pin-like site-specific DNA recombinase
MAVALYLRVSTEEQRERQSIATQRAQHCLCLLFSPDRKAGSKFSGSPDAIRNRLYSRSRKPRAVLLAG